MHVVAVKEVPLEDIIPLRESLREDKVDPTTKYPDQEWDYLTLYDQRGTVLARSRAYSHTVTIHFKYRGMMFICTPGYNRKETVSVEWNSLLRAAGL